MSEESHLPSIPFRESSFGLIVHLLISVVAVAGYEWYRGSDIERNWHVEYQNVFLFLFTCVGTIQLIPFLVAVFCFAALKAIVAFTKPSDSEAEIMIVIGRSKRVFSGLPGLLLLMSSVVFLWPALRSVQ